MPVVCFLAMPRMDQDKQSLEVYSKNEANKKECMQNLHRANAAGAVCHVNISHVELDA